QEVLERAAVEGGGLEELIDLGHAALADQRTGVHGLGAGVVEQVRRVPADEPRLQIGLDVHRGGDLHVRVRVHLRVLLTGVLRVLVAVAAVEDDDVDSGIARDAEGVVVGHLAVPAGDSGAAALVVPAATTGGAGAQGRRSGAGACQA